MSFLSYVSSAFTNTQFISNASNSGINLGMNIGLNYLNRGGQLKFLSPRGYDSVIVYAAKRTMMQLAFAKINDLYPAYVRNLDKNRTKVADLQNQGSQMVQIVGDTKQGDEKAMSNGARLLYMGKPAPEALVLWVPNESGQTKDIAIQTYWDKIKNLSNEQAGNANSIADTKLTVAADEDKVFWDLGPTVQMQSSNNVVLTKVQGRDFSRKELISGGDVNFTVTGKIVSNYPDVYPYEQVSKFITLMQTKGVLRVSNLMFSQFNVTQILIKDFQMGQNEGFKNVQPYSFTCVGVEPDEAVKVVEDTIQATNLNISKMPKKGWSTKLLEQVKATAAHQAAQMIEQLTAKTI